MKELERAIDLYELNRSRLCRAIEDAGDSSKSLMADAAYRQVLVNLAANHIRIEATYIKDS